MRTLLAGLAAVVISTTAFVATFAMSGGFASHALTGQASAETIDPTVGQAVLLTAADAAADGWTADCAHWGQVYGQVMITGARTIQARGCVNPAGLGRGDSFTSSVMATLLVNAER